MIARDRPWRSGSLQEGKITGAKQLTVLTLAPAERYYVNNFVQYPDYRLAGPKPDKRMRDVWDVYRAATASQWPCYFLPGLVMMVGYGVVIPDNRFMVMFAGRYHQRFVEATSDSMVVKDKGDFIAWLQTHTFRG